MKNRNKRVVTVIAVAGLVFASNLIYGKDSDTKGTFKEDVKFLQEHTEIILLKDGSSAVAVAPAYQGRVMTSSFDAENGDGFGWINRKVVEAGLMTPEQRRGKLENHIYVFGGEERFWMGPEGGQFAIFFKPGAKFDFDNWFTPPCIDVAGFDVVSRNEKEVKFTYRANLQNWTGTKFTVGISRIVSLLDVGKVKKTFGIELSDKIRMVAYETDNRIKNMGDTPWTKETGLLSIWILGMYPPSKGTTLVIPFKKGDEKDIGSKVNDSYFGKVPGDYLKVGENALFFKGDGTRRGKIGIGPKRSLGIAGSYDSENQTLNLVTYNVQAAPNGYVNSMWEMQKDPFSGDVLNAYNDGAPTPGAAPLGPFYEIETSSPAAALKPGEEMVHVMRTLHIQGSESELDAIARASLGVGLKEIKDAFTNNQENGKRRNK